MSEDRAPEPDRGAPRHRCHRIISASPVGEGGRVLITTAAAFIVLFALKYTREFTLPIVLAAFLAIASYPFTELLKRPVRIIRWRVRLPHWVAVAVCVLVDIGIVFGVFSLVKFLAADVVATLRGNIMQQLDTKYNLCMVTLDQWGLGDHAREWIQSPLSVIDTQYIISFTQSLTGRVISFMSVTTVVLLLMTFILGEAPLFIRNFSRLPNSGRGKLKLESALRGVQRYLVIKTVACVCTGLLAWFLCHAVELPFAFLWGVVACVLNFIPTIGSIVASLPPILLALALKDWSYTFIVAGGYVGINFAIGNGIEPIFLGKQFGIATSVVLFSVIIWGWVWGPVGMLLAVPITLLAKLSFEESADLKWLAAIIDDKPSSIDEDQTTPK